jgi:hypothetical protein
MGDIDSILERLVGDSEFRRQIKEDPAQALAGYDLDSSEREMLVAQLSADDGDDRQVEQRTSKSALGSFLAGLVGGGGSQQSGDQSSSWIRVSQQWVVDPEPGPTDQVAGHSPTDPGDSGAEEQRKGGSIVSYDHHHEDQPETDYDFIAGMAEHEDDTPIESMSLNYTEVEAEDDLSNAMGVSESADGADEDSASIEKNELKWVRGGLGIEAGAEGDELVQADPGSAGDPSVGEVAPEADPVEKGHDGQIDVESFSWGSTGSDPDQPIITGRVYNESEGEPEIAGDRGGRAPEYLEIEMKDAIVSSYQLGDQEEVPSDMVSDQPDDAGTP